MDVIPFQIHISGEQLDDLRERWRRTRWPQAIDGGWGDGTSLPIARRLVEYWRTGFDWRAQEERLNRLPQFTAVVDGLRIHFVHHRGRGTAPFPLILTHGWPGSFVEMERIIPLLTDPASHGGDPRDSFDIVVPSLPGFGFSQQPELAGTFTLDELLTNIAIYWFTGTIGSSMRIYRESRQRPVHFAAGERVQPPLGVAEFPRELPMPPRSWVERVFDVRRWTRMPRCGHFAALEAPEDLAVEIREFFRPLRDN